MNTRYFVLTGGETIDDAIKYVEDRHGEMISAAFYGGASIAVYGAVEVSFEAVSNLLDTTSPV